MTAMPVKDLSALTEDHEKPSFQASNQLLQEIRTTLKTEFIGLDAIIDRITDAVLPWLMVPELNGRPTIINLWGMTGVGKSSLVNRLAELLGFQNRYFRFDLGSGNHMPRGIQQQLGDLFPHHQGKPMILAFDEFQHARTLNENEHEVDKGYIRTIWEILDSGKFQTNFNSRSQAVVYELLYSLAGKIRAGVEIENGVIVKGMEAFAKAQAAEMKYPHGCEDIFEPESKKNEKQPVLAVSNYYLEEILEVSLGRFRAAYELRQHLQTLNGPETLSFLLDLYERSLAPQVVDCSKALVFIMGNLDEAYPMAHELNPDISADEFHLQSLRINVSNIRRALSSRFRMEQIARLGSCHIIYPSFSKNSYEQIIRKELDSLIRKTKAYDLDLEIDPSLAELIYQEGVIPTQGIRPVLATIQEIVGAQIAQLVVERIRIKTGPLKARLSWENGKLRKTFLSGETIALMQEETLNLTMVHLRKSRRDDLQAITAVHESGHAILAMAMLQELPESIHSITATDDAAGFVFCRPEKNFNNKKELSHRIAILLGGMAAESIVFGPDQITTGSESDLERATELANTMIQRNGFGADLGAFTNVVKASLEYLPNCERQHRQAEEWIRAAYDRALDILQEHKALLIHMANHLSDHPVLTKNEIMNMVGEQSPDLAATLSPAMPKTNLYRDLLKNLAREKSDVPVVQQLTRNLVLNKENTR